MLADVSYAPGVEQSNAYYVCSYNLRESCDFELFELDIVPQ